MKPLAATPAGPRSPICVAVQCVSHRGSTCVCPAIIHSLPLPIRFRMRVSLSYGFRVFRIGVPSTRVANYRRALTGARVNKWHRIRKLAARAPTRTVVLVNAYVPCVYTHRSTAHARGTARPCIPLRYNAHSEGGSAAPVAQVTLTNAARNPPPGQHQQAPKQGCAVVSASIPFGVNTAARASPAARAATAIRGARIGARKFMIWKWRSSRRTR